MSPDELSHSGPDAQKHQNTDAKQHWQGYHIVKTQRHSLQVVNDTNIESFYPDFVGWTSPDHEPEVIARLTKTVRMNDAYPTELFPIAQPAMEQTNLVRARDLGFFTIVLSIGIGGFSLSSPSIESWLLGAIVGLLAGIFLMLMDRAYESQIDREHG